MKLTRKLISIILVVIMIITMTSIAIVSSSAATNLYSEAAMRLDTNYAYDGELGAIYSPDKTVFKVWSPLATKVVLNTYATGSDKEEGAEDLGKYDMVKLEENGEFTGVWTYEIEGNCVGLYYTYTISQPKSILGGAVVTKTTQDVYSYAVGVNGDRTMVCDLSSTDPEGWDNDQHIFVDKQTDASIWEIQVKDFSYNENSGVSEANRGKYLAFTEFETTLNNAGNIKTCISYLKDLGITHVQINPFYDFQTIDEAGSNSQFNWGYDPKNYGVPEGSYSSNPYDGNVRINECKQMIQALHKAGIGVIMDVVYNHTYSVDSCFNYSVPEYYYRMNADGSYSQQSGCGNDTASERAMYRKYMRDMILYWTNEYHIDGYRFDLMGVHDCETMNLIRSDLDEIDSRFIMYGEGWSGNTAFDPVSCTGEKVYGCTQTNSAKTDKRIGFFNDVIRDGIKGGVFDGATTGGFVSGVFSNSNKISYGLRANTFSKNVNWTSQAPTQTLSYASCHDNNTLYDKLVAVCHGISTDYRARYNDVITQNKFAAAIVKCSQGIDFMLAGEEMGRSKDGDENSYKSPASINMIDWNCLVQNADLVSYYKGLLELRKVFSPFTADTRDEEDDSYKYNWITSYSALTRHIAVTIDNETPGEWNKVAIILNSTNTSKEVSLANDKSITADTEWVIIANDKSAGVEKLGEAKGTKLTVAGSSALIAVEKSTFEKNKKTSKYCNINVQNVLKDTGEVYSSYSLKGMPGEGYETTYDTSVPLKYEFSNAEGKTSGKFTNNDTTITYNFDKWVPDSVKKENGDVNNDGVVDIIDSTIIQKWAAHKIDLTPEQIAKGNYNYDEMTDVLDSTYLQKILAKFDVTVFSVTTNHIGLKDGKEVNVAGPYVVDYRIGSEFETSPISSLYYVLTETPKYTSGVVSNRNETITYKYEYQTKEVNIYVKHSDPTVTWKPCLWAWIRDENKVDTDIYSGWPGLVMNELVDGWYHTSINSPAGGGNGVGYCLIISNNGSPQTDDYVGLNYDNCYIVIDDAKVAAGSTQFITIYDYNPELENE